MQNILIFPHQLFETITQLNPTNTIIYLIEESLFFGDKKYHFKFHKQKLILHRASMKHFEATLKEKGFQTKYIEYKKSTQLAEIFKDLQSKNINDVYVYELNDYELNKRINAASKKFNIQVSTLNSPNFLTTIKELQNYFKDFDKYQFTPFYIYQRKKLNLLLTPDKSPLHGKWSFDTDNRKKLPKAINIPPKVNLPESHYVKEAKEYIEKNFPNNYGDITDFNYPINHNQAKIVLKDFLENKLKNFGPYEDAISKEHQIAFHSLLTPSLNIGLLTPNEILTEIAPYLKDDAIPYSSKEGFIRQIIGWREYMRAMYNLNHIQQRTKNFWKHTRKIPQCFWTGDTGIEPIDHTIKNILKTGYSHHIERLMVIGNFMLLCEFDPDEVYKWFMEMFIDSYDWVMVPNVYAMSQYADGGNMTTKPYISGANYIHKMSDYKKDNWSETWTALYWHFIQKHQSFFKSNPRLSMMSRMWDKMEDGKKQNYLNLSKQYFQFLDTN